MGRSSDGGENFGDGGFAGFAIAVVDAALRERKAAAAGAGFGVEFMERDGFLFRRKLGEIHTGKFGGTFGVLQEDLAFVLKSFHFDVADRQTKQRTDFCFVENRIAEAFVLLHHASFGIENEGSGKRGNSAVLQANLVGGERDGIVDAKFCSEFLDGGRIVVIHGESEDLQAVLVFVLELDEIGNFGAARSTPGGPKINEDDFALGAGKSNGLAVEPCQLELWRGIGIANEADGGLIFLLCSCKQGKDAKK